MKSLIEMFGVGDIDWGIFDFMSRSFTLQFIRDVEPDDWNAMYQQLYAQKMGLA